MQVTIVPLVQEDQVGEVLLSQVLLDLQDQVTHLLLIHLKVILVELVDLQRVVNIQLVEVEDLQRREPNKEIILLLEDQEVQDILRITRPTTEKLCDFAFRLAARRKARGGKGMVTCVDKANVFRSMAFFRKIFDERKAAFPDIRAGYNYVDAQALDLIRRPWDFDVLVMENMFGDILSDLAGGLVGGMGMAACAEVGDGQALFQPAHGSAPDIMGQDRANPLAAILSGALMLDYLADKAGGPNGSHEAGAAEAAGLIGRAVDKGFAANRLRPMEFGGDMGTKAVAREVIALIGEV